MNQPDCSCREGVGNKLMRLKEQGPEIQTTHRIRWCSFGKRGEERQAAFPIAAASFPGEADSTNACLMHKVIFKSFHNRVKCS